MYAALNIGTIPRKITEMVKWISGTDQPARRNANEGRAYCIADKKGCLARLNLFHRGRADQGGGIIPNLAPLRLEDVELPPRQFVPQDQADPPEPCFTKALLRVQELKTFVQTHGTNATRYCYDQAHQFSMTTYDLSSTCVDSLSTWVNQHPAEALALAMECTNQVLSCGLFNSTNGNGLAIICTGGKSPFGVYSNASFYWSGHYNYVDVPAQSTSCPVDFGTNFSTHPATC